jgi:hypothetical protein
MTESNIFDITGLPNCEAPDCDYQSASDFWEDFTLNEQGLSYVQIWDYDDTDLSLAG